jgi:endonuclease YncB( thermonuclease family)
MHRLIPAVLALTALLLPLGARAADEIVTGAASAIDAETLSIGGRTLKIDGIEGPALTAHCSELTGGATRDYACGLAAKAFLMSLMAGRTVSCVPGGGRVRSAALARCFADGRDVGEALVFAGWAVANTKTGHRYIAAQESARGARRGLWSGRFDPPGRDPTPR